MSRRFLIDELLPPALFLIVFPIALFLIAFFNWPPLPMGPR